MKRLTRSTHRQYAYASEAMDEATVREFRCGGRAPVA